MTGCLIIHGFGGNTAEVAPLAEYLRKKGFLTVCPELAGHTGRRRDLVKAGYREWIASAEKELHELRTECDRVVLVGFSMGGLIAVNLLIKHGAAALITLNMPVYQIDFKRILINLARDVKTWEFTSLKRYIKSMLVCPITAMYNFKVLLKRTVPLFKKIDVPLLILQSLLDDTVQHRSAAFIYRNVLSKDKEIKYYENSGHLICHDADSSKVLADVAEFIARRLPEG